MDFLNFFDWPWWVIALLVVALIGLIGILLFLRNKRPEE